MAKITAAMVKDLREKTGAGMMDCKNALNEDAGRHRSRGRLAAQEGPVQGRQEVGPRRGRRPRGGRGRGHRGRRSSRSIPKPTSSPATTISRSSCAASPASRSSKGVRRDVEALKAAAYPGGGTVADAHRQRDRDDRREHDAAPRRRAEGRAGRRSAQYVHNAVGEGLGKIGVIVALEFDRRHGRARRARPADRHACRGREPARRSTARASIRRSSTREKGVLRREERRQAGACAREDRRKRAEDLLQGGLPARSGLRPRQRARRSPRRSRRPKSTVGAPIALKGFVRFALGEGVDKPETPDFASEVASMV